MRIVVIVSKISRVKKKFFSKKVKRSEIYYNCAKNRLKVLVYKENNCSNFEKKVTTIATIVGISHFFLLQF